MWENPTREEMATVLKEAKTIAVVGLSDNESRTSYQISKAMQAAGYKIIPVNPNVDQVLGEKAYKSLTDIEEEIDIINVFRRSEFLSEIAEESIHTVCKVLWLQHGIQIESSY